MLIMQVFNIVQKTNSAATFNRQQILKWMFDSLTLEINNLTLLVTAILSLVKNESIPLATTGMDLSYTQREKMFNRCLADLDLLQNPFKQSETITTCCFVSATTEYIEGAKLLITLVQTTRDALMGINTPEKKGKMEWKDTSPSKLVPMLRFLTALSALYSMYPHQKMSDVLRAEFQTMIIEVLQHVLKTLQDIKSPAVLNQFLQHFSILHRFDICPASSNLALNEKYRKLYGSIKDQLLQSLQATVCSSLSLIFCSSYRAPHC